MILVQVPEWEKTKNTLFKRYEGKLKYIKTEAKDICSSLGQNWMGKKILVRVRVSCWRYLQKIYSQLVHQPIFICFIWRHENNVLVIQSIHFSEKSVQKSVRKTDMKKQRHRSSIIKKSGVSPLLPVDEGKHPLAHQGHHPLVMVANGHSWAGELYFEKFTDTLRRRLSEDGWSSSRISSGGETPSLSYFTLSIKQKLKLKNKDIMTVIDLTWDQLHR